MAGATTSERDLDGTTTEYCDVPVAGDRVERLLRELFTSHWKQLTVGPIVQGAAWEIRFTTAPALSMLDGYLTVDVGPWHFHLCVGDTRGQGDPALARARRVGRAAFFRASGGTCVPESYGLRLWNGLGEQMVTVFFPNPFYDDAGGRLREPEPGRTALWEDFRRRYGG
ncbi:MAG: DUF7676 family protein [Candidatus Rokuibacteriota bacterium]